MLADKTISTAFHDLCLLYMIIDPSDQSDTIQIQFFPFLHLLTLGKLSKQIFGKSWEFGPTGLTPTPLPERWDSQKRKKINVYFAF